MFLGKKIDVVLSIGTGTSKNGEEPVAPKPGIINLFNRLVQLSTDAEQIHFEVRSLLQTKVETFAYHRLNPRAGNIGLDASDDASMQSLQETAERYIQDNLSTLRELASLLTQGI